ncbi:thioredoxin family protein [Sutcliffiella rhizosphaerae]|uniref:Small peptidoglycan-associated lipoprotein n=1 Tax=Sutcliffiella rhizosphaerae TaxID=2880967 RepID=A0ABN8A9T9_9BACI|nr:thioredoxin family protein [Sutcliffiella rhizosphaerae]CAG9619878.1 hypothetical protein BACCIP111883_00646 [Sutcliffiella rhizosphaerae]
MMRGTVIVVILSFLFLSSCQQNLAINHVQFPEESHTLVFFTDDSDTKAEGTYYDAIIDIKSAFPTDVTNINVVHSEGDKKLFRQFNVTSTPTIVVVHQNEILTQIEGPQPKEQIVVSIEEAIKADITTY